MIGCSPSFHCPDGRCLLARTCGYSRARNPHGCHYRRSPASTPGSHTRKSTAPEGRRRPRGAAQATRGVAARRARCSGLQTPASWCRAQGRARAASGAGLRRGHGRTDGRAHLAWHRLVVPAAGAPAQALYKPSGGRALPTAASCAVIGAGKIPFWPITFGFCCPVNRAAL